MKLWPLLLVAAVFAAGCAPKVARHPNAPEPGKTPSGAEPSTIEKGLYGRWVGAKPEEEKKPGQKDEVGMSNSMAAMMGGFSIDLRNDYSFRMDLAGTNLDGTWELKGDEVRMTVEHVMGKSKAEYATLTSELDKEFAKFFETPPSPKVRDSGKRLVVPHESAKGVSFAKES